MQLNGKVALVTGAGQGIGASIAVAMAREGAKVAVVDMNGEMAEKMAASIRASGGIAQGFACNVADRSQVNATVEQVASTLGGVGILVS